MWEVGYNCLTKNETWISNVSPYGYNLNSCREIYETEKDYHSEDFYLPDEFHDDVVGDFLNDAKIKIEHEMQENNDKK